MKPLDNGDQLYQTMMDLEEKINENKVVAGKLAPDVAAGWLKALERTISKIEYRFFSLGFLGLAY